MGWMAISTFTLGYFGLKRATALVTALSSAVLPKAISRRFPEALVSAAKPQLQASQRLAARKQGANVDFTVGSKGGNLVKKRLENAAMLAPTLKSVKPYLTLIFNHKEQPNERECHDRRERRERSPK